MYDLGDARCWVDDNEKGAVNLSGWWDKTYNVATYVTALVCSAKTDSLTASNTLTKRLLLVTISEFTVQ